MDRLSVAELQRLLDDDSFFREYVRREDDQRLSTATKAMDRGANSEAVLMELKAGNCAQAKANLAMEEQVKKLQSELKDLQKSLNQEQESYRQLLQTCQNNSKKFSKERLLDRLKGACSAAEAESERIAERFLSGQSNLDEFCRVYRDIRILFHIRQIKLERSLIQ